MSTKVPNLLFSIWAILGCIRLYEALPNPWLMIHLLFYGFFSLYTCYNAYRIFIRPHKYHSFSIVDLTMQILARIIFLMCWWNATDRSLIVVDLVTISIYLVQLTMDLRGDCIYDWVDATVDRITAKAPPVVDVSDIYRLADPNNPSHKDRLIVCDIAGRDTKSLLPICERTLTDVDRTIDFTLTLRASRERYEDTPVDASQEPAKHLLATNIVNLEEKTAKISKDILHIAKQVIEDMRT
ncbi:MAG: hypothetical protein Q9208_004600 [Pyrenodesmia sp. 3 TL-2023]